MNRNQLKIIACASMLIDHIGYILFHGVTILRLIGRIAMPLFAFFIGEGCLYTKDRKKYFLRVFLLGVLCQAVYIIEGLISNSGDGALFNILLTFSVAIILCSMFLKVKTALKEGDKKEKRKAFALLALTVIAVFAVSLFCDNSYSLTGIKFEFDYGIWGMCLPLFAAVTTDKVKKLLSFSAALLVAAVNFYESINFILWALVPIILLLFYNGKGGKANLKYFFYAFYPVHLAALYLIDMLV